jgi:ribosome-binding factor A
METKRQKQVAELVKRNFGILLQQEGAYIYGHEVMVTVTGVKMSPDLTQARIYLSVFNTDNKQAVILEMEENQSHLRQVLANRLKRHVRRIPDISFFLDDTIDEMYRLDDLFKRLHQDNQMGDEREE